mmetsp:Transcript_35791/g.26578  ORF Transcript_35791/g.26578 Transcript_35791/m.26578 type:complete len:82 (-) Transcript_35791:817-1062(-)
MLLKALDYVEFLAQKDQLLADVLENAKKVESEGVVTRLVEEESKEERGSLTNEVQMSASLEQDSQQEAPPVPGTPVLINPR